LLEVSELTGREVLIEVDASIVLIVGNSQWVLEQQIRPHPFHFLNIIIGATTLSITTLSIMTPVTFGIIINKTRPSA
jgi:hypothetical protein